MSSIGSASSTSSPSIGSCDSLADIETISESENPSDQRIFRFTAVGPEGLGLYDPEVQATMKEKFPQFFQHDNEFSESTTIEESNQKCLKSKQPSPSVNFLDKFPESETSQNEFSEPTTIEESNQECLKSKQPSPSVNSLDKFPESETPQKAKKVCCTIF